MTQFDSPTTKLYVGSCIALAKRLVSNTVPLPSGAELVGTIQNDLAIPTSVSELPPAGILGICVNLITIVSHDSEDPIEIILRTLSDEGLEFVCFPGAYDREFERERDRISTLHGVSVYRFQLRVPNPPSNQMSALQIIKQFQLSFAEEAIVSPKRLVAVVALSDS